VRDSANADATLERASKNATLFALLWAYAMVVDTLAMLRTTDTLSLLLAILVIISAVAAALKPTSLPRVLTLAFLAVCQVLDRMPNTPNHWMATVTINLTIGVAGLWVLLREKHAPDRLALAYRQFMPAVRVQFVLVYLIAAFHKTNWDYLNPSISCASNMAGNVAALFFLPRTLGAGYPSIIGSLMMEYGIPLLLLIPRTRLLGTALGLGFHFVLGFDSILGVVGFSAVAYALYPLFLPADVAASLLQLEWLPRRRTGRVALIACVLALTALLTVLASAARPLEAEHTLLSSVSLPRPITWNGVVVRALWHAYALVSIFAFTSVLRARTAAFFAPVPALGASTVQRVLQVGFPALVLLVGIAPYAGYKTVPCFSMFSNLRTEGGVSNHLLLGTQRLSSLDTDLVEIVDSSSPSLRQLAKDKLRLEYFEFRRLGTPWSQLQRSVKSDEINAKDFWVEYRRNGAIKQVSRSLNPDAEEFHAPPWVISKALAFRPVLGHDQAQRCVW
jgi:hypothetical protein